MNPIIRGANRIPRPVEKVNRYSSYGRGVIFCDCLEDEFGLKVDVLTYESLEQSLITEAIKDKVVLYKRKILNYPEF